VEEKNNAFHCYVIALNKTDIDINGDPIRIAAI
jgi:hypothetical protein